MKLFYSAILFIAFSLNSYGQSHFFNKNFKRCFQDEWLEEMEKAEPGYKQKIQDGLAEFNKTNTSSRRSVMITIPIHVIIVHPSGQPIGSGSNHSLAHVQSQIDVLNQDFGRYNADAGNTPPDFPAADTGIQFCLATVDPDGNPTDGITRYAFDGAFHPNSSAIRQETRWPRETYANIWSAPNLPYLGLASLPSTFGLPPANNDFMHVDAAAFGGPGFATFPNYNLGRTTTHEMGHYLGLPHVWGNGGCASDDGINDTPIQEDENFGCPNHPSPSCNNGGDMFMNYMDYVNDNCMNAFSVNQGDYMNTILTTSRASLLGAAVTACATNIPLEINVTSQGDPSCSDSNDGFILVEASGGSPDYTYSINGSVPAANNLFTDLGGGSFTLEAFDADGNSAMVMAVLNAPLPLTATVNVTQENECPNDMNGAIQIQVSGGTNPYTYALNMGMPQSSNTFEDLPNGFYVVAIEDTNGCSVEEIFELTGSSEIIITIDSTAHLTCTDDSTGLIIASAEGGNGPISYSINGMDYQVSGEFINLDGGMYYIYAQDSVGCYDSLGVVLEEPDTLMIDAMTSDVSCYGEEDGSITATISGGNGGPFMYSFDNVDYGDESILDSLGAGEYDLYVKDTLGCLALASVEISQPDELIVSVDTVINVECFGDETGMVELSATGGNGDYIFIVAEDSTSTGVFNNLSAGNYNVKVIDALGCEGSTSFEINTSSTISISIVSMIMPSCYGFSDGMVEVEATNTEGMVNYSINGGPAQNSPVFTGLSAGEQTIEVQDESGCNAAISFNLPTPLELEAQVSVISNVSCNGGNDGSISIEVMGGTPPYTYSYDAMGVDPTTLAAGVYTLVVTDANGCEVSTEFTITEPSALELSIVNQVDADCDTGIGAVLELEATGGNPGYTYTLVGPSGTLTSDDGLFDGLQYGSHDVTVTDEMGCTYQMNIAVGLENMFYAEITSITNIACFSEIGGGVAVNVQGGAGIITYYLDGAVEYDSSALSTLDTHAGDHILSVVDENDCTIELPFTLIEPDELVVDDAVIDYDLITLTIYVSGGVEPYIYSFDGGETYSDSNVTDDLGASIINVVVQDANGCEVEYVVAVDNVNDIVNSWGINAYPNPSQNDLYLELNFPVQTEASIEVFDTKGRRVHNISAKNYISGDNFVKIDLSNFASSIYIIKIASAEGYRYIKVTKM